MTTPHVVGYNGMWAPPGEDPRSSAAPLDELTTIREYLTNYRLTLEMKGEGLTPEQLATRSVPPSTMSLLGLVRHMARVENNWFHRTLRGHPDDRRLYWTEDDQDLDFNAVTGDQAMVDDAFASWREQIAYADAYLDEGPDLGATVDHRGEQVSVRDILIHMIEEYARHCGHADLLRECIDGRTGQ